jgi:hypothetical protein
MFCKINRVIQIEGVIRRNFGEVPEKNTFKVKPIKAKSTPIPDSETVRMRRTDMGRLQPPVMTYLTVFLVGHKNSPFT